MAEQNGITLFLTPEIIEAQCQETIKQARNASHALAALIALQTFIAATVQSGDKFSPAYEAVKAAVERHAADTRARILAEKAHALALAMQHENRPEIARIHAELSRNGFWQAAQQAMRQLGPDGIAAAAIWAADWCQNAKASAQAASGFPEAFDFGKAGVSATEYAAMSEINIYLTDLIRR